MPVAAVPWLYVFIYRPPTAQIEVPNAEIRPLGDTHSLRKRRPEVLVYVVEDAGHALSECRC